MATRPTKSRCPVCKQLTVEAWVHQLNRLALSMYRWEQATHPSSWPELLQTEREQYRKRASSPICTCGDEHPTILDDTCSGTIQDYTMQFDDGTPYCLVAEDFSGQYPATFLVDKVATIG